MSKLITITSILLSFIFTTSVQAAVSKARKDLMYKGIRAHWKHSFVERKIRFKLRWLPKKRRISIKQYAKRLVNEVVSITSVKGNSWLPPEKLLGLGTTESNLTWWTVVGWKDNLDCGITQIAVKWQEKTYAKRRELCGKLVNSTKLGFQYTMKILNHHKKTYCGWRYKTGTDKFNECIFNIYNQGQRFLRSKWRYCKFKRGSKKYWRCKFRNRYWLKTVCFARMYELGRVPKGYCRRVTSLGWINRHFR